MSKLKLGIDFGSTYTYIFSMDDKWKIEDYRDRLHDEYDGSAGIPTKVFHNGSEVVIGAQAVENRPRNNSESIKDSLRSIFVGEEENEGREISKEDKSDETERSLIKRAKKNAVAFFNALFTRMGVEAADIESIVCGIPAPTVVKRSGHSQDTGTDRMTYSSTIQEIFAEVFKDFKDDWKKIQFECIEEPILACVGAIKDGLICEDDNVLVIDLGGGTNDFAYVKQQSNGKYKYKVEACRGGHGPGGNLYDKYIQEELNNNSRFEGDFNSAKCWKSIKVAKELVFKKYDEGQKKDFPIVTPSDTEKTVKLTYNESIDDIHLDIATLLNESFADVADEVKDFCEQEINEDDRSKINKVLFAGGCSHIGPLTDMIEQCLNQYFKRELTYVHIKDDYGIETTLSNSNAVAYGALFYKDIGIEINEAITKPSGWQFKVSNQKVELELEFLNHSTCGWFTCLPVKVMLKTYAGGYQQVIKIEGMPEIVKWTQTSKVKFMFRFWLFKDSMIKEDRKRLPKNGSYGITLEEGINRLKIFIVHTINFQFFVFIFNGKGNYTGFRLWPYVALDKTHVRCLMDGENYVRNKKLKSEEIKKILEDYSNGEKITI